MKAIIVSDLHIGSQYFLHKDFERLLGSIPKDVDLILNGDVIDDPHSKLEPQHQRVLDLISQVSHCNKVVWVRGNHEDGCAIRGFENVSFKRLYSIGDKLLIAHGHYFDEVMPKNRAFMKAFKFMHDLRLRLGATPVHVAEYAKKWAPFYKVLRKNVMINAVKCAADNGYEAVTCGHTHYPEDTVFKNIRYINTGAWTEFPAFYLYVTGNGMALKGIRE